MQADVQSRLWKLIPKEWGDVLKYIYVFGYCKICLKPVVNNRQTNKGTKIALMMKIRGVMISIF